MRRHLVRNLRGPLVADEPIVSVDFSSLALGKHTAAAFLSATGFTFTRASSSTVQTSASTIVTGVATDEACIGSSNGTDKGLVIQNNTKTYVGVVVGAASPRNLNTEWAAGSATTTYPYADSPDGSGTGCSRVNAASGQYGNYGDPHGAATTNDWCFSSWQRSKDATSNGGMQQGIVIATPGDCTQTVRAASNTWGRVVTAKGAANGRYYDTVDARNYSGSGGETARARDVLVDYIQLERGSFATEAIPTALTRRSCDVLKYASGSSLLQGGRIKFKLGFYPKHSSSQSTYYDGSGASGAAAHWHLCTASGFDARIRVADRFIRVTDGVTPEVGNVAMVWSAGDFVEVYVEMGNGTSLAKYRVNGGAWTDLGLTGSLPSLSASGAVHFCNDIAGSLTGDDGSLVCRLKSIVVYSTGQREP